MASHSMGHGTRGCQNAQQSGRAAGEREGLADDFGARWTSTPWAHGERMRGSCRYAALNPPPIVRRSDG